MSPLPSCPSPPFWLFCGSSAPWRPPPQTTDTKRRAAKLGLILVCAGSEWAAYCEKPSRACMEMPGRPFTRGPCPGQPCSAHPPPHPEWCAPIAPPLLCWHSTTFCTFQPSSDSWERIVRLFGRLINFDKQLTECNPGSASLSSNSDPSHLENPEQENCTEAWSFVHFSNHVPHSFQSTPGSAQTVQHGRREPKQKGNWEEATWESGSRWTRLNGYGSLKNRNEREPRKAKLGTKEQMKTEHEERQPGARGWERRQDDGKGDESWGCDEIKKGTRKGERQKKKQIADRNPWREVQVKEPG